MSRLDINHRIPALGMIEAGMMATRVARDLQVLHTVIYHLIICNTQTVIRIAKEADVHE